jgi:hypothetical protein
MLYFHDFCFLVFSIKKLIISFIFGGYHTTTDGSITAPVKSPKPIEIDYFQYFQIQNSNSNFFKFNLIQFL